MATRDLLATGNIFTTTAALILIDTYGTEALTWDPETIKMELQDDFHVKITDSIMNKMMLACQLITTNRFYTSLPDFIYFCNEMNDEEGLPNVWDPADAEEVAWSMVEVGLLDPPESSWSQELDPEILAYITVILRDSGIKTPPDSLSFIPSESLIGPAIAELSDDPELFAAATQEADEASEQLNQLVNERTYELMLELQQLTLKHGSLQQFLEQMMTKTEPPNRLL